MKKITPGKQAVIKPASATASSNADEQKRLKALIARRHPEYEELEAHWDFLEGTYEGGREWFDEHIFRYLKEGDKEYEDRVKRAYRFNHTREVVDLVNKYLFKQSILRNEADAPESVKRFWKSATKSGLQIKDLIRQVSKKTSISGRIGIIVDNVGGGKAISKADEKDSKIYAYVLSPEQLLDYSFDQNGDLNWALVREVKRDDDDPFESSGAEVYQYRLWTKTDWKLYEEKTRNKQKIVELVDEGEHGLGEVPLILADNIITDELWCAPSLIDDIAYLDRAVANYLSNLDAIIQDQTFSQLVMPAQNVLPGEDAYNKMLEMGTKRIFLYDGEGGASPSYLSPDPKQAAVILDVVSKIINEIYHTVGLAGERTKEDNSVGIDNSSGVAKAYDFERVNALLAAKADSLEMVENKICAMVARWAGEEGEVEDERLVMYPDNFDTRGLYDEFDISTRLALIEAPDEVRREQMRSVLDKLFPQIGAEARDAMEKELKDWPKDPLEMIAGMGGSTMGKPPQEGRKTGQGQVKSQKSGSAEKP